MHRESSIEAASTHYDPTQWQINWRTIAEDMQAIGLTFPQQARMLGREITTYQRWLTGSEPRFSDANAILTLHSHMCGRENTQMRLLEPLKKA